MMSFVPLLLVTILFPAIQTEELTKCQLYPMLKDLNDYRGITMPEWMCTLFHTSAFNTGAIVQNDGSTEYGLFQISDKLWCKSKQTPHSRNICGISCDKLLDNDLTDDIKCAKKILDIKGIDYWLAHKPLCTDRLEQWRCEEL
ncbi:alpha-lactalbumin [Otolemur garnettii]|uniref:Alpha-lactalbumin n=1 Tax=Otolemur garnettii TaxID=30611 RepID=H0XQ75_OTOGA|nr:alpha-lactalbumin [Otolemur garnettii]